eukprot:CAMPEP_0176449154 /NCGR_PEP_ID=MMETSP0127-20121128/26272_1 /TAXON_ID=938130 /ORGANISM="Platyophrya macrostoma, Strain WH" /LENGTH=49 /DNA_ID= /DNA_START= /DNA_END= /DNA_ORIENTATION=
MPSSIAEERRSGGTSFAARTDQFPPRARAPSLSASGPRRMHTSTPRTQR